MNKTLPATTPLVGDDAFVVMHDKHHQYPEYPFMFIPMKPEMVGNEGRVGFSEWCGPFGLRMQAKELGETIPNDKIEPMVAALLDEMRWRKRPLTNEEFRVLLRSVCANAKAN
jgi:isopropylmalate/homocitrate/citramalate synthase